MRTALVAAPLGVLAAVLSGSPSQAEGLIAQTTLRTADGKSVGRVMFLVRDDKTYVRAYTWLGNRTATDAFHGFHIHANNDPANGSGCAADPAKAPSTWFVSADGHLSETGTSHGKHTGDFPSLLVGPDGSAQSSFTTTRLEAAELEGRALILHANPDNFGNIPLGTAPDQYTANSPEATTKTGATGNAGDRVACGVIEVMDGKHTGNMR